MYEAEVLADSVSGLTGTRLITIQATFPRFILAEVNTHRVFSRNSASSRAIPPEKQIARIQEHPFVPEAFHKRVKGMGQGEALDAGAQKEARYQWERGRDRAVETATKLMEMDIAKSHVNRVLEPYMWHTAIISSTEWENFFALRTPPGDEVDYDFPAQPEFQRIGILMRQAMRDNHPSLLMPGEWHTPLVGKDDTDEVMSTAAADHEMGEMDYDPDVILARISAGRCAKVSYETQGFEEISHSLGRTEGLTEAGHMSPLEHTATPQTQEEVDAVGAQKEALKALFDTGRLEEQIYRRMVVQAEFVGNFRDWVQLRKQIPFEWNRVGFLEQRNPWWTPNC